MGETSGKDLWGKALGISTVLATVCCAISDFLKPILNSTLYLALFFLGLTLLVGLIQLFAGEKGREKLKEISIMDIGKYWFGCLFSALMIFTVFLFITYTFNSDDADGFLADNVPFVANLQEKWHMVEKNLTEIAENTRKTTENTEEIKQDVKTNVEQTKQIVEHTKATEEHSRITAENTGQLVEQGKVQTELLKEVVSPQDAKKQLAQKGYPFTVEGYASQVMAGNLETLKLYYEAGWDANTPGRDGFPPVFNAVMQQTPNFERVIEQAIVDGKFNVNKKYSSSGTSMPVIMKYGTELFTRFIGTTIQGLPIIPPLANQGRDAVNIGCLIALQYPFPDSAISNFIKKTDIDMAEGVKLRKKFAEELLRGVLSHNKTIQQSITMMEQNNNRLRSMDQNILKQLQQRFKQQGLPVPSTTEQDAVIKQYRAKLINEKKLRQRLAEFRKGTEALANAAKNEG